MLRVDITLRDGNQPKRTEGLINAIDTCLWRFSYHFVAFVSIAPAPDCQIIVLFSALLNMFWRAGHVSFPGSFLLMSLYHLAENYSALRQSNDC